jgi:CHAT domain-containing protein
MQRILISLLMLFIAVTELYSQEIKPPVVRFSHPALDEIQTLVNKRRYKSAIELSLASAEKMKADSQWEGYISFMLRAAEIETFEVWKAKGFSEYEILPDYSRPRRYLKSLQSVAGRAIDDYPYLKANILFTNAVVFHWLDMSDTAEALHDEALALRKAIYGEASREVADSYLWRGVLYKWGLQRKDQAEKNYRLALPLQQKYMPLSRYALGSVCYGLAEIARENFQFDEALAFANQYLTLYQDIPYEQAFGIQLIANVYWNQDDFEKSLHYRRQAVQLYKDSDFKEDLIVEYSNLSNDFSNLQRYAEAEQALKEGEKILKASKLNNAYSSKMLYENFGNLYRQMKRYDASEMYFARAMEIAVNQYGQRNDKVANVYRMRGNLHIAQGNFEDALKDYHRILLALIPDAMPEDYRTVQNVQNENPYFKNIIAAAFLKGDAFMRWHLRDGSQEHLRLAHENYKAAFHQIILARQRIGDELSKTYLTSNFLRSIGSAMSCASLLYRRTGETRYVQDLFYSMEITKYLNVLDALQRARRANHSPESLELTFQLKSVRSELTRLQRAQLEHQHLGLSPDSVRNLGNKILDLIDQRRNLIAQIETSSGNRQLNPDSVIVSLNDIQRHLAQDEQIVTFSWGADSVYSISIGVNSALVHVAAKNEELERDLQFIHSFVEGKSSFQLADIQNYSITSSRVFQKLFPSKLNRRLIIIPDGSLNLIPIEALVTNHEEKSRSYRDLRYLIHEREISYAYSVSILFHSPAKSDVHINNVLAFSYSGYSPGEGMVRNVNVQDALPGTDRELESLSSIFDHVTTFTDKEARKENFIGNVSHKDLIHLGIHGIGNPDVADNSRLIFRSDSTATGDLYAYDIYNLNLDASLVVLSACETGLGKRQSGEGIFSIARAFSYAGCPSVVMSMWRAHDSFTATIMEEFYRKLSTGNSISGSLRESKLKFLSEGDEFSAHPSNWATFVMNGQDQTFSKPTPLAAWMLLAAGGMGILIFGWWWKIRRA